MLWLGVPICLLEWVKAWVTNTLASVKMNGTIGRCPTYKEELPHGSPMSPPVFTIYNNSLLGSLELSRHRHTLRQAYVDVLLLACSGRDRDEMGARLQSEVKSVARWMTFENSLTPHTSKTYSTMDNAESTWCPNGKICTEVYSSKRMQLITLPGIRYDRQITFNVHSV